MILPAQQSFSAIPLGGVFSDTSGNYYIKTDGSSGANLANGSLVGGLAPTLPFYFWPNASLDLG